MSASLSLPRIFIVLYVNNCITPPAVFGQKNGSSHCYIMQYLAVIAQIRNRFNIWHKVQLLSAISITQSAVKFNNRNLQNTEINYQKVINTIQ